MRIGFYCLFHIGVQYSCYIVRKYSYFSIHFVVHLGHRSKMIFFMFRFMSRRSPAGSSAVSYLVRCQLDRRSRRVAGQRCQLRRVSDGSLMKVLTSLNSQPSPGMERGYTSTSRHRVWSVVTPAAAVTRYGAWLHQQPSPGMERGYTSSRHRVWSVPTPAAAVTGYGAWLHLQLPSPGMERGYTSSRHRVWSVVTPAAAVTWYGAWLHQQQPSPGMERG